jgi:hypothetical protein
MHTPVLQDWRWAVGCLPWGPYANSTELSGILASVARRNILLSHTEAALAAIQVWHSALICCL